MSNNSAVLEERPTASGARLFSLAEVAEETGISMKALQRYATEHPDLVPHQGTGRKMEFPEAAFDVLRQIRDDERATREGRSRGGVGLMSLARARARENGEDAEPTAEELARRAAILGESEDSTAPESEAADSQAPSEDGDESDEGAESAEKKAGPPTFDETGPAELTLRDIAEETGIAYPTIARYAAKHTDKIPHTGSGRKRRFPKEAVEVFEWIRKNTRRGRPPKKKDGSSSSSSRRLSVADRAALERRIQVLEESHGRLETQIRTLLEHLDQPVDLGVTSDESAADAG